MNLIRKEGTAMIYIGNHISSSDGFLAIGKKALSLDGDTFAFFTRNPRGGSAKAIVPEDAAALREFLAEHRFGKLVAHAPYTMNLCSDKENIREFARNMLADDLQRMEYLPGNYYNFHPGSHVGQGKEQGIAYIAEALNAAMFPGMQTTVLLETMAGKGSEIGNDFEDLAGIIEKTEQKELLGVCIDTCHLWDGGHDISASLDAVLKEFDRVIGMERLKAVHLNDSMNPFASHKDRHEKLGQGMIGEETLRHVVTHPLLQNLPFILETPNEDEGYRKEIATVRNWMV